jgi:hypothetical protein
MKGAVPQVFAVEDRSVQVHWSHLPSGTHAIAAGVHETLIEHAGGPGATSVEGLEPNRRYDITVNGDVVDQCVTLATPPGEEVTRIATLSDLHLGERAFGRLPRIREYGSKGATHSRRCVAAALPEIVAWGAQLLVIKGDISQHSHRHEYEQLAEILENLPIPALVMPGNHDGGNHQIDDLGEVLGPLGVEVANGVFVQDHLGLRMITADTVIPGRGHGSLDRHLNEVLHHLSDAPGGALLLLHHQLQPGVPTYWPLGIAGPGARRALDAIAEANPDTVISSGHTHRHRRHDHGPLVVTEVGAPIHYPGSWAGYVAHSAGIRQVVRRVADPDAIGWTERTGAMLGGLWSKWSMGTLSQRCFTHAWANVRVGSLSNVSARPQ